MEIPNNRPGGLSFNVALNFFGKESFGKYEEMIPEDNYTEWILYLNKDEYIFKLTDEWDKIKPEQKILDDFKICINETDMLEKYCYWISSGSVSDQWCCFYRIEKLLKYGAKVTDRCINSINYDDPKQCAVDLLKEKMKEEKEKEEEEEEQ